MSRVPHCWGSYGWLVSCARGNNVRVEQCRHAESCEAETRGAGCVIVTKETPTHNASQTSERDATARTSAEGAP